MTKYKLHIHDRTYTQWTWIPEEPTQQEIPPIKPTKMFTKDIILYDHTTNTHTTTYSHVRSQTPLAGILVLQGNRTYGRTPKSKLLYKVIPDDKHLPVFLVPYDNPSNFSKVLHNKYVVFHFDHWIEQHPRAKLLQTLGDTQQLEAFYEYQLYCKSLHLSLTPFTNQTKQQLDVQPPQTYIDKIMENFDIQDRRDETPFSIDPHGSTDFDDAFSIRVSNHKTHVSVYIANVYVWLETLHLWQSMTNRVSTIYLPDRKRPMLPTILSDQLCSLQQGQPRFAFAIDLTYDNDTKQIVDHSFSQVLLQVEHNFRYETPLLQSHPQYQTLYDLTKNLDKHISDSHDVVSFWMIQVNKICGEHMAQHKFGIFRQATFTRQIDDSIEGGPQGPLSTEARRTIQMWNNVSGQYVLYNESPIHHDVMKLAHYTHITSPIRRIVDLLNQLSFLSHLHPLSSSAQDFLEQWIHKLPYINTSMRSIRKIQTDCEVLHRCSTDPCLLQTQHKGILFDKVRKNDGGFVYMVYLEELRLLTRFKSYEEYENLSQQSFQLFLFTDEHSLKKKIRVQMTD